MILLAFKGISVAIIKDMETIKKSLKALEFEKISEKLAGFAKLKQSRELCLGMSIYSNKEDIQKQLKLTAEAKKVLDMALELPIERVAEIKELENSTLNAYLSEEEIVNVAKTLRSARLVRNFLKENCEDEGELVKLGELIFADKELEDRFFAPFDSGYKIKQDATTELRNLFNSLRDSESNLKTQINELLSNTEFSKHLQEQIYTTRDERVVFQVKASDKSKVDGIIHDISASSQSFYIEPKQLVSLDNKIRELKIKIHAEIVRILSELTKLIKENLENLKISENILSQIDFHFAKARYAVAIKAVEPEIVQEKILKIEKMRHPLLIDYVEEVVENNFEIGKDYKAIIISGSNTGGKTIVIKTAGLFLLMTKAGLFLPCSEAKVYPFENIYADIGDEQSIAQSLSTFSSHMSNIINILNLSNENTFVVLDEICAGTSPQEGAVLAQVILEKLAEKNVTFCVTTHFGELKALEFENSYFKNACVEFDSNTLKPTFKFIIGIPGLSNAILISANLGLGKELVARAKEMLVNEKDSSVTVLENLQRMQEELSNNLKQAENANNKTQKIKEEYEKKLSELKKDKKSTIKHIKNKFDSEFDEAKDEIRDILKEMRAEKSEKIARRSYSRLAKLEKNLLSQTDEYNEAELYEEVDWDKIKLGEKCLLKGLNQEIKILSMPDKNGNIDVMMGLIKTKIKKEKIAKFDEGFISPKIKRYTKKQPFELKRLEMSNKLDLRGYRVDVALDSLENYLDKASLANLTPVYIIHGHGTGALKSAIQDFLKTSPYVGKYRFGENTEGGDGVSVVDIK